MNHLTERRPYAQPEAEIVCLAPQEGLASFQPWFEQGDEWWAMNKWGKAPDGASIVGGYTWLDVYKEDQNATNYEQD